MECSMCVLLYYWVVAGYLSSWQWRHQVLDLLRPHCLGFGGCCVANSTILAVVLVQSPYRVVSCPHQIFTHIAVAYSNSLQVVQVREACGVNM